MLACIVPDNILRSLNVSTPKHSINIADTQCKKIGIGFDSCSGFVVMLYIVLRFVSSYVIESLSHPELKPPRLLEAT